MTNNTPTLQILSTIAVRKVLEVIVPEFEIWHGAKVEVSWGATLEQRDRILAGARADVAIITADAIDELAYRLLRRDGRPIDELEDKGILTPDARADLVASDISIAARPGEPVPDVSTVESFKAALLQCRAVAYSQRGASGVYFAGLLERLGIAEQVNARAVVVPQGLTGPRQLTREADLAVQQTSELMQAEGINIFAKLPADVQQMTVFSIGTFKDAPQRKLAEYFIAFLLSPLGADTFRANGLAPVGPRQ